MLLVGSLVRWSSLVDSCYAVTATHARRRRGGCQDVDALQPLVHGAFVFLEKFARRRDVARYHGGMGDGVVLPVLVPQSPVGVGRLESCGYWSLRVSRVLPDIFLVVILVALGLDALSRLDVFASCCEPAHLGLFLHMNLAGVLNGLEPQGNAALTLNPKP